MRGRTTAAVALFCAGTLLLWSGAWIQIKAVVAQGLLEFAWGQTVISGEAVKPWPWADHWPVARIHFPKQGEDFIVLRGDSGASLAFGPGWNIRSAAPGERMGVTMISGHRDTHFRLLEELAAGDHLVLENSRGRLNNYQITNIDIVDYRVANISSESTERRLVLVTCYPFDAVVAGGPMRYVVTAERVI